MCPTPAKNTDSHPGFAAATRRAATTGTNRSASPCTSNTGTRIRPNIARNRSPRANVHTNDRVARKNDSSLPRINPRPFTNSTPAATIAGSARLGSAKHRSITRRTAASGVVRACDHRIANSPTPGIAYVANIAATPTSGRRDTGGNAGSTNTNPATPPPPAARVAEITPPIEFPTNTAGPPTTARRKTSSNATFPAIDVSLGQPGVRPNPRRSSAYARRPRANDGATNAQFRCEPPKPCTNTIGN